MTFLELSKNRLRSLLSTEFLLTAGVVSSSFYLALQSLLTKEYISLALPVMTFVWGRTKQKLNGN